MRQPDAGRCAPLSVLVLLLLATAPAGADTVFFRHGTRLECKVEGETPEGLRVLLPDAADVPSGLGAPSAADGAETPIPPSAILDPETIERIEYDFESRTAALEPDDWQGHYDLGRWAEERGMRRRALMQYLYVQGKEGVPTEVYLRIGRLYEAVRPPAPKQAAAAYRRYLHLAPEASDASGVREALERLETAGEADPSDTPDPSGAVAPPAGAAREGDWLEAGDWQRDGWGNEGSARTVENTAAGDDRVLELRYRTGDHDKAAFTRTVRQNLSNARQIVFDVYNPENHPVKIAVALTTLPGYTWYESGVRTAQPGGWTTGIAFNLTRETWKSEASNWAFKTSPGNLERVERMSVLVYNPRNSGVLYLDRIHFEEETPAE